MEQKRLRWMWLLGFASGMGIGYFVQTVLNNGQEPTPPDGIIGALGGGVVGAIIAKTIVRLRGDDPIDPSLDQPPDPT